MSRSSRSQRNQPGNPRENDVQARRRTLLRQIAELVGELAELDLVGRHPDHTEPPATPTAPSPSASPLGVGSRVRITRNDVYRNRTGTIVSPHGALYWNIQLDHLDHERMAPIIHKMLKFLQPLDP